jgi:hypothetical protein
VEDKDAFHLTHLVVEFAWNNEATVVMETWMDGLDFWQIVKE